ncbi:MAG: hypothetical protein SVV03_05550, partial [Candidatus Nanohaloarchaea archaeon]|nr:hypothetical protein [Candidatus Nanohaloarchaea archaeon]
ITLTLALALSTTATATTITLNTQNDWNQGQFNLSSADRQDNSGKLGIGYRNTTFDNLTAYYRFDKAVDGSTGTATDYSGNGNSGSLSGGIATGRGGAFSTDSYRFDGSNDYVDIPTGLVDTTGFTVSYWMHPRDVGSGNKQDMISLRSDIDFIHNQDEGGDLTDS